jgi:hypothetical protein
VPVSSVTAEKFPVELAYCTLQPESGMSTADRLWSSM